VTPDAGQSDPLEVGRLIALRQLESRPRTERELHETLCGRGIPAEVSDELVARFVEVGLLDDRVYAQMWVESRMRTRGLGVSALRRELRSHKVPDSVIDEVLAEVDSQDTLMAAVEQVHGRVARCAIPLSRKDEHRLVAFLMRRGHDYDLAREAIALAVEEVTAASGSS